MSSSTSLARSRSLRKPASGVSNQTDTVSLRDKPRNASPSRLPVKGLASFRAVGTATGTGNGSSGQAAGSSARSRPVSGALERSASLRQTSQANATGSSITTSRPLITTRNRLATRSTPTSESAPSTAATRRPTTSSGVPSSVTARPAGAGHARTRSTATTLTGATTLQPPSQPSTTSSTTAAERARNPPAPARSLHRRQVSASTTISTSSTAAPTTTRPFRSLTDSHPSATRQSPSLPSSTSTLTTSSSPSSPATATAAQPSRLRPAFTTLQQHYSPAKTQAPKPLTSTFLAPPSPSKLPANLAASAETARLQAELLQLHLLHAAAATTDAAWRASARDRLGGRFRALAAEADRAAARQAALAERANAAELLRLWGSGGGRLREERVQALDAAVAAVWGVGEPAGRFARVARRFERWADRVAEVVAARGRAGAVPGEGVVLVSELETGWAEERDGLVRRLEEARGVLAELGAAAPPERQGPSVARMLAACESLAGDMLAELELMRLIEGDALEQENEWVRSMTREDDAGERAQGVGAIWRVI